MQPLHSRGELPAGSVLIDTLRPLESELARRAIIPGQAQQSATPVWFLAETERNVFLWRQGLSLLDADQFEFWVDTKRLIEKRLDHLERVEGENPFVLGTLGDHTFLPGAKESEQRYLMMFHQAFSQIFLHAHALSQCVTALMQLPVGGSAREIILLPGMSAAS